MWEENQCKIRTLSLSSIFLVLIKKECIVINGTWHMNYTFLYKNQLCLYLRTPGLKFTKKQGVLKLGINYQWLAWNGTHFISLSNNVRLIIGQQFIIRQGSPLTLYWHLVSYLFTYFKKLSADLRLKIS